MSPVRENPTLELQDFLPSADAKRCTGFVTCLRETAHCTGCFYLVGHGLSLRDEATIFAASRDFFALP